MRLKYATYFGAHINEEQNKEAFDKDMDDDISRLVKDPKTLLYPRNKKYAKLSSIDILYELKTISGWSCSTGLLKHFT